MIMLVSFVFSIQLWAGELSRPTGKVLLTLSGNIENTNADRKAVPDTASPKKLDVINFQTTSPWYNGHTTFMGIPLQKLMNYVGANSSVAKVTALSDYATVIPLDDFKKYNAILTLRTNGKCVCIRNRSPLFIVYPYDSMSELNNQIYYSRPVWQVGGMDIE